ncbi:zinc finger protein 2 homolog [Sander lucioperca]|uniref:zinc finger protein 2 homolog n=1 Tax=Sander lucioperca TaxID=283035 RepID=UPI001653846C|nr:zinc finger protein 2 homolog [Sander lucioperca]
METEADGEDCGGPEPARNSHPLLQPETEDQTGDSSEPETGDSADWKETREPQSALNSLKHDSGRKKTFSCSECGRRFGRKTHLKTHTMTHTGEKPFSCSFCNTSFTQSGDLQKHMRVHTGEKPFSCSVCNTSFTQSENLRSHMRTHTGEKPFSCSECGRAFTERGNLKKHMMTHTGEKPFSCSVCNTSFTRRGSLRKHMAVHTGEKRFSCSLCSKRFAWRSDVKTHKCVGQMETEAEELWSSQEGEQLQGLEEADITKFPFTPVPVKSEDDEEEAQSSQLHQRQTQHMGTEADGEDCGGPEPARNSHPHPLLQPETEDQASDFPEPRQLSSFAVASQFCQQRDESREPQLGLNSPKKSRYNSREKLFRCSECGKQFNQNSNLKTHMRTHTGEKPFSCPFCSKRFGQKAHLQNHLKCHTGEKPYRCSVCGRRFSRFEHMKLHMRTHTGERPFSCNSCGKRFTWLHQFKTHKCGGESSQLQEEPWSSQEGEQLQGLEEADITKFPFTPVPVKSEDDEEEAQSSQLHQRQSHPDSFYSHGLECNPFTGQFW